MCYKNEIVNVLVHEFLVVFPVVARGGSELKIHLCRCHFLASSKCLEHQLRTSSHPSNWPDKRNPKREFHIAIPPGPSPTGSSMHSPRNGDQTFFHQDLDTCSAPIPHPPHRPTHQPARRAHWHPLSPSSTVIFLLAAC